MSSVGKASTDRRGADSARVFLSYSRANSAFVERLAAALKRRGVEAFVDRADIEKAEEWWARIQQLITEADSIVFVLSPDSLASAVAQREVDFASTLNKRFLPVVAAEFAGHVVPEALARLNYIYFIEDHRAGASGDFDEACDQLVHALHTDIGWIREHSRLGELARRWEAAGEAGHFVLRGPALEAAEKWLTAQPKEAPNPTPLHRRFIAASRKSATRRLRLGVGAALTVALVSIGLAAFAWMQKQAATSAQKETFVRQADLSASLAFRLFEQGDSLLGLKVAQSGAPAAIGALTPLQPRLELALSRGWAMVQEEAGLRHPDGQILDTAWSPDGRHIVTATVTDGHRIWNTNTGQLVQSLSGVQPEYFMLETPRVSAFSRDGRRLATLNDGRIRIWDTERLVASQPGDVRTALLMEASCPDSARRVVGLSRSGGLAVGRCRDGIVVWDANSGKRLWSQLNKQAEENQTEVDRFALVQDGSALLVLGPGGAAVVEDLDSSAPKLRRLDSLARITDGELYVAPKPSEVTVVTSGGITRVDVARDIPIRSIEFKSKVKRLWSSYASELDVLALAWIPEGRTELAYQLFSFGSGKTLRSGVLNFTGRNAYAEVQNISLSSDGQRFAVALNTGFLVLRLDRRADEAQRANVQQLESSEQAQVIVDAPCTRESAPTQRVQFAPDATRILLLCEGITRVQRLTDKPAATLGPPQGSFPMVIGIGPSQRGVMRLVALDARTYVFERADSAATPVAGSKERSAFIAGPISDWKLARTTDAVLWIDAAGQAGSWTPNEGKSTHYEGSYGGSRAIRLSPDGARAAILTKDGALVRLTIGTAAPQSRIALGPPRSGVAIPDIAYDIAPDLAHVAFTTKDLRFAPALDRYGVFVSAPTAPADGGVRFTCLKSAESAPAALIFGDDPGSARVYFVDRNRMVATAPLSKLEVGSTLAPLGEFGTASVTVEACPATIMENFVEQQDWSRGDFSETSVRMVSGDARLLYADGLAAPIELIDLKSARRMTDLIDGYFASYPIAVSADGRYFALMQELANGVAVFDSLSGTLLRKLYTDDAVALDPKAVTFDANARSIYVRVRSGAIEVFPLQLKQGEELLQQIRELGLQPISDTEKREIYEFRKRFPRTTAFG